MAHLPRNTGVRARRGCGVGVASPGPLSPCWTPLLQVGVDTRCTSRGPPPCQTQMAAWTPALAQVRGPGYLEAGGGELWLAWAWGGGLIVQAGP